MARCCRPRRRTSTIRKTTLISRTFGVVAERLPPADAVPKAQPEPAKQSARERLKKHITLSFEGPVERGLAAVVEQIGLPMRILRADLDRNGRQLDKRV